MSLADSDTIDVLVIGAGPTGIGAATRLKFHGKTSWMLVDALPMPGVPPLPRRGNRAFIKLYIAISGLFCHIEFRLNFN